MIVITVPIVAGFILAGPPLGLAVGALAATGVAVVAARARYDEPIEVASATDDRYHLLIVAAVPLDEHGAARVAERVVAGPRVTGIGVGSPVEVLVLAPALNRGLSHWASDLGRALVRAQERLVVSLATLATASVEGRGSVGDSDPVQATEDTLRTFPAQEVLLVERAGSSASVVEELRRRLDRPLHYVEVTGTVVRGRE